MLIDGWMDGFNFFYFIGNSHNVTLQIIRTKLTSAQTAEERLTYIKTIGNTGEPRFTNDLLTILRDTKQQEIVRVECIWATRRIVSAKPEKV